MESIIKSCGKQQLFKFLKSSVITATLFVAVIWSNPSLKGESSGGAERFQLKKDFVSFTSLWNKDFSKNYSHLTYDKKTEILSYYYNDKVLSARGAAKIENGAYRFYGLWNRYYTDGTLLGTLTYKNGALDGVAKGFYKNGKIAQECTFSCGDNCGLCRRFDSLGRVLDTVSYNKGTAVKYEINYILVPSLQRPAHLPKATVYERKDRLWVHRNKAKGIVKMWFIGGEMFCEVSVKNIGTRKETLHGYARYWHRNGNIATEGSYNDGKQLGVWKIYDDSGQIKTVADFKEDGSFIEKKPADV